MRFRSVRTTFITALLVAAGAGSALAGPAEAKVGTPGLQSPANKASVQALPVFSWGSARGAASYQFEMSADPKFSSGVPGFQAGGVSVSTTAVTDDTSVPNGTYYWRVRAVSATDQDSGWSRTRTIIKNWSTAPQIQGPSSGATIDYPSTPLVMKWSAVPYATTYDLVVATDPQLASPVLGSLNSPFQVQGTEYALPSVLAAGTYYWAVQPVDAEGNRGVRSSIGTFTWAWPSDTTVSEVDDSSDNTVVEPQFNWAAIPGAASYELEINRSAQFPSSSDVLDQTGISGTSYTPTSILPNETALYWRVRGIESSGNAGQWNTGSSVQESFDNVGGQATITGFQVVDGNTGNVIPATTYTTSPIISWNPVAGASSYVVTDGVWTQATGCDYSNTQDHTVTVDNPRIPLYDTTVPSGGLPTTASWTAGVNTTSGFYTSGTNDPDGGPVQLCFQVYAQRDDSQLGGGTVDSVVTYFGGPSAPAVSYTDPASGAAVACSSVSGLTASTYRTPADGANVTSTPTFSWNPVLHADGYFLVIAYDQNFTNVIPGGLYWVRSTSYSPGNTLLDSSNTYWWEVIPAYGIGSTTGQSTDDQGVNTDDQTCVSDGLYADGGNDSFDPQSFTKNSIPPTLNTPANGATVQTQPTFSWGSALGARNYTIQIAATSDFANPLDSVTTDSTSYTTSVTLPAGKTLYWRVRANDVNGDQLNFSAPNTFTHVLPVPTPSSGDPTSGSLIPELSWSGVTGAQSYDFYVTQSGGSTDSSNVAVPAITPNTYYGTGLWQWQVRADYPGGVSSAYSSPVVNFLRTIPPPSGVKATKSGNKIQISWTPDPIAHKYQVQISTTDGFASPIASDNTDDTVWVPQLSAAQAAVKLYWRVGVVASDGNDGAFAEGIFKAPAKPKPKKKKRKKK